MPLPRRSAEHRLADVGERRARARLDAEGAGQLGVRDRRAERARAELEGDVEDDVPARVGLEPRGAVAEAAVGGGEGADAARAARSQTRTEAMVCGDLLAVGADVLDRGGADRAGDAGRAPRRRPSRARRRAATRSSQLSPAATVTSTPPHDGPSSSTSARRRGGDLDDGAGEAGVGDHQVAAAAEHQDRLAGGVRGASRPRPARPRWWRRPSRAAGPPSRSVVWSREQLSAPQARTTALGMPSTFCPSQVTVSSTVVRPSSASLDLAGDLDLDAALGGYDDRAW